MAYKNILVALDTRDEAAEVLESVQKVMSQEGSSVSIFHVIRPLTGFYVDMASVLNAESKAIDQAFDWLERLAERHDISPDSIDVVLGTPTTEIWRKAQQINADLVVLGTHGRHGHGKILGSTANGVCNTAPCDVLAIRV